MSNTKNIRYGWLRNIVPLAVAGVLIFAGCENSAPITDTTPPTQSAKISNIVAGDSILSFDLQNPNSETVAVSIALDPTPPKDATVVVDESSISFLAVGKISLTATGSDGATKPIRITGLSNGIAYTLTATTSDASGNARTDTTTETATLAAPLSADLTVTQSISPTTVAPGYRTASSWNATVTNSGVVASEATTLRYFTSSDAIISTSDTQLGSDSVSALQPAARENETSPPIRHAVTIGTHYVGVCVDTVPAEINTRNNCSTAITITTALNSTALSNSSTTITSGSSTIGGLISNESDYYRIILTSSDTLTASTTGSIDTYGHLYNSSGTQLTFNDDDGTDDNFSLSRFVTAGTYYIRVRGFRSSVTGSYTLAVSTAATSAPTFGTLSVIATAGGGDFTVPAVSENGTLFWAIYTDGATAPANAAALITAASASPVGSVVATSGSSGVVVSTGSNAITITGLSASTSYDLYAVIRDSANNTSALSTKLDFTTAALSADLTVTQSISPTTVAPGYSFSWDTTVTNSGDIASEATTLRYFLSNNAVITTLDISLGTDSVSVLQPAARENETTSYGSAASQTFHLGVCVDTVPAETNTRNTRNNCSTATFVTIALNSTALFNSSTRITSNSSRSGSLVSNESDYYRIILTRATRLFASTTGNTDTYGHLYNSSGTQLAFDDDDGTDDNFSLSRFVNAGTYYIRVRGFDSSVTGSYTLAVSN